MLAALRYWQKAAYDAREDAVKAAEEITAANRARISAEGCMRLMAGLLHSAEQDLAEARAELQKLKENA